jgi:hypothetical protein
MKTAPASEKLRQSRSSKPKTPPRRSATSPFVSVNSRLPRPGAKTPDSRERKINSLFEPPNDRQVSGAHVRITLFRAASLVGRSVRLHTRLCIAHLVVNSVTVESPRNERCPRHAQRGARLPRGRHRGQVFREAASPRFRPARCRAPAHAQRRQGCRLQRGTFRGACAVSSRSRSRPERGRVARTRATPARRLGISTVVSRLVDAAARAGKATRVPTSHTLTSMSRPPLPPPAANARIDVNRTRP